jgi:hypothetical protein
MRIPRLLVFSLLISVCAAPAVAQSAADNIPGSFFSELPGALSQDARASLRLDPIQLPIEIDRLYFQNAKPAAAEAGKHDGNIKAPSRLQKRVFSQNDTTCLSIRSYRVRRDDPESDTTRLVGYSTCQPATKFQVKEATERQEIVPR